MSSGSTRFAFTNAILDNRSYLVTMSSRQIQPGASVMAMRLKMAQMVNNIHDNLWQNIGVSCKQNTISQTYNMGPVPRKSVFGVSIKAMLVSKRS